MFAVMVAFTMSSLTATSAELNQFNHWINNSEYNRSLKDFLSEFDYGSTNSEKTLMDKLHIIFEKLKSSSFPTAVANLTNQKCVNDSLLYLDTLYSLSGSNASWARQSKQQIIILK